VIHEKWGPKLVMFSAMGWPVRRLLVLETAAGSSSCWLHVKRAREVERRGLVRGDIERYEAQTPPGRSVEQSSQARWRSHAASGRAAPCAGAAGSCESRRHILG